MRGHPESRGGDQVAESEAETTGSTTGGSGVEGTPGAQGVEKKAESDSGDLPFELMTATERVTSEEGGVEMRSGKVGKVGVVENTEVVLSVAGNWLDCEVYE